MSEAVEGRGLKFRAFGWNVRIWKYGIEYGTKYGGVIALFPWSPVFRARSYK